MKSNQLSAVIYSYNNELDIADCIKSVLPLTKDISLIDLNSQDKTAKIAEKMEVKVVKHPFVKIVEEVRDFGIQTAKNEWVLIVDADERLTPELIQEILSIKSSDMTTHYQIPRKEIFARKIWFKHGGWWPNYQTRIFKKNALAEWPKIIHAAPQFKGEGGTLESPLLHYSQNNWAENVEKTIRFEDIESQLLYAADKPVSTPIFFRKYFGELYRRLIKNQGFMDGQFGITESIYQAFSKTITYLFLYEKKKKSSSL